MITNDLPEGTFFLYVIRLAGRVVYVGQTQNPRRRWRDHRGSAGKRRSALACAIQKHGAAAFSFEVLPVTFDTQPDADGAEVHMIKTLRTYLEGYNLTIGGSSNSPSVRARARMSSERTGRTMSEEQKRKLRGLHVGRQHSADARRRMSEAQRLRWALLSPKDRALTSANRRAGWEKRRARAGE